MKYRPTFEIFLGLLWLSLVIVTANVAAADLNCPIPVNFKCTGCQGDWCSYGLTSVNCPATGTKTPQPCTQYSHAQWSRCTNEQGNGLASAWSKNQSYSEEFPSTWKPSVNQCAMTSMLDPGVLPSPPSCPPIPDSSSKLAFKDANGPPGTQYATNMEALGMSSSCVGVTPRFNWIIATCDSVGGIGGIDAVGIQPPPPPPGKKQQRPLLGSACATNPFSTINVHYVAAYELSADGSSWKLQADSSINADGSSSKNGYADLTQLLQNSPGAMWAAGYYPKQVDGVGLPAMLFVISYDDFYNGAFFVMNQVLLDRGPEHSIPNCDKSAANCWGYPQAGGMGAGEIDILESPFWDCAFWENPNTSTSGVTPSLCSKEGYQRLYVTSGNNSSAGGPLPEAFYSGGSGSSSYFEATGKSIVAAVIDAMGTTVYLNPTWTGITATTASGTLTAMTPSKFAEAIYLPRGCPGSDLKWGYYGNWGGIDPSANISSTTKKICTKIGTLGAQAGLSNCTADQGGCGGLNSTPVTPGLIWWDQMIDTGNAGFSLSNGGKIPSPVSSSSR